MCCPIIENKSLIKITKKENEKHTLCKNTTKIFKILTFPSPRLVPRTTPDDQNYPREPPGPPLDTLRKPFVFSVPPGPSPRSPRGLPGTPPETPRDSPETPGTLPRTPRDLPETSQDPPRESPRARGPPQNPPEKPRDTPDPLKQARRNARSD